MLSTLDAVILVLIVSAGMLAFVVLYNLNNINITERQRELATDVYKRQVQSSFVIQELPFLHSMHFCSYRDWKLFP